jgi:hypothetical protein
MADLDRNNQFHISLPEGWIDQSLYVFNGPDEGGFQHSLMLVIDNVLEDDDLERFAQERIDGVLNTTSNTEILKQEKKTLANGTEAVEVVIKWIPVEGKIIFQKRVYMIIDDVGYSFTANFTKQTMKTIGLDVSRMIESFRPEGG